jgi:mono/diheme cytochrome c family protein
MNHRTQIVLVGVGFLFAASVGFAAAAAENWENNCTKCHGADGKGQTKAGKKLNLKDYTDPAVQAKMTDEEMTKAIVEGVSDKGKEKMKSFKEELSADEIKDLVAYVRKFKG